MKHPVLLKGTLYRAFGGLSLRISCAAMNSEDEKKLLTRIYPVRYITTL